MKCLGRNRTLMKQKVWRTPSPSNQSFRWMAGVYYLDTKRFISTSTGDDNLQGIVTVKRQPQFGNLANPTLSFLADNNHNRAWALFGNVAYDLPARLELSFPGRYDKDRRPQEGRVNPPCRPPDGSQEAT